MIRDIIVAIFAGFLGVALMYFTVPFLKNAQNIFNAFIETDEISETAIALGDIWYMALGFVVFFVIGLGLITRAHGQDGAG